MARFWCSVDFMVKDFWGQEIKNGDFVCSASKSSGEMVMGVMKDVEKQTRVRIDQHYRTKKWTAASKSTRMYTLDRVLKLPDEMIAQKNPELFDTMNDVRERLSLPTTRDLKDQVNAKDMLQRMLEAQLKK